MYGKRCFGTISDIFPKLTSQVWKKFTMLLISYGLYYAVIATKSVLKPSMLHYLLAKIVSIAYFNLA